MRTSIGLRVLVALGLLAGLGALSGCSTAAKADGGALRVVAAFYPLQFVVERVGGPDVQVTTLTRPGAEPHDVELRPRDLAAASDADVLVYLAGFQPAVDDVATRDGERAFDVTAAARLDLLAPGEDDAAGAGVKDPHFWLDPARLADVTSAVATRLAAADPGHAAGYRARADALRSDLAALDGAFRAGLARCAERDLVTGHAAFGYLARRYGLVQRSVTGLDPGAEPRAGDLASVTGFVRDNRVSTVYTEALASPAIAQAVADGGGARLAVLDPVEAITSESAGPDYLAVMRHDLAVLRAGQRCA